MLKFHALLVIAAILNASVLNAQINMIHKTLKEDSKVCDQNSEYFKQTGEECAVKKVRFETQNYSTKDKEDPAPYYGTLAYFGFETNSWKDLTKYGFVQMIRGCTYESSKDAEGNINKRIGETIMHLGKKRIYVFPEWSVDATTTDPLYYGPTEEDSKLPGGRLALHRWTPKLGVVDSKKTKDLYEMLRLPESKRLGVSPSVFVTDAPSMAYTRFSGDEKTFQNVSLEFEICLYNLADIPLAIDSDAPMTSPAISCFKWSSQFEYNFELKKFENKPAKGLDEFCASQVPVNPAEILKRERELDGK